MDEVECSFYRFIINSDRRVLLVIVVVVVVHVFVFLIVFFIGFFALGFIVVLLEQTTVAQVLELAVLLPDCFDRHFEFGHVDAQEFLWWF